MGENKFTIIVMVFDNHQYSKQLANTCERNEKNKISYQSKIISYTGWFQILIERGF